MCGCDGLGVGAGTQSASSRRLASGLGGEKAAQFPYFLHARTVLLLLQLVSCASAFSMPAATKVGAARMAFKAPAPIRGISSYKWGIFNRRASSSVAELAPQPVLQCPSGDYLEVAKRETRLKLGAGWGLVSTWLKTGVYTTMSYSCFPPTTQPRMLS
jgi:hypothetical protein